MGTEGKQIKMGTEGKQIKMGSEEGNGDLRPLSNVAKKIVKNQKIGSKERQARRDKAVMLIRLHLQNFLQMLLTSRRQAQQRLRRRQAMLHTFYMQLMTELQTRFLEIVPMLCETCRYKTEAGRCSEEEESQISNEDLVDDPHALRYYEDIVISFSEEQWLSTFHMSQRSFQWLCSQLHERLQPNIGNNVGNANQIITLGKRVALGLYALATGSDYRSISLLFNVSRTSVCKLIKRFANAVLEELGSRLLAMPKGEREYQEIRTAFKQASNMPALAVGVLAIYELPVNSTDLEHHDFTRGTVSGRIVMQSLIDDRLLFRKIQVNDDRPTLFMESPNEITQLSLQYINEHFLPCFVAAPPGCYPLRTWLMKPYQDPIEPHEYDFNEAIDNLQIFREVALQRLFGRWKILSNKVDLEPETMKVVAAACCALHNFLEENEEYFSESWTEDIDLSKYNYRQNVSEFSNELDSEEAVQMRDFLARTISSTEI